VTATSGPDTRQFFNVFMAGRACDHGDALGDEVDRESRDTLMAMASFVGLSEQHKRNPVCVAAQETIAKRAKVSVSTVASRQERLAALGLIVRAGRTGQGLRSTVRWRMPVLLSAPGTDKRAALLSVPGTDKMAAEGTYVPGTDKQPVPGTDKQPVPGTDNNSSVPRNEREGDRGGSDAADAAPSAGATGTTASPSPTGAYADVLAEIEDRLGLNQAGARSWADRKLAGAGEPVRNEPKYLRACLDRETTESKDASPSKPKGASKGRSRASAKKSPAAGPPTRRRRSIVPEVELRAAVERVRAGEPLESVADDPAVWISHDRLRSQVRHAEQQAERIAAGELDPPPVASAKEEPPTAVAPSPAPELAPELALVVPLHLAADPFAPMSHSASPLIDDDPERLARERAEMEAAQALRPTGTYADPW
jgi:hypothetical protein